MHKTPVMFWTKAPLTAAAAWAFSGIVASVAMFGPLFFDEICYTEAWESHPVKYMFHKASAKSWVLGMGYVGGNVPCIGMFFWEVVLGSFLLGYLLTAHRRFEREDRVHKWTRRYLTAMMMVCGLNSVRPWIFIACPQNPDVSTCSAVILAFCTGFLLIAHACLGQIAVLRLSLVADHASANRARRLMIATILCGLVAAVSMAVSHAVSQAVAAMKFIVVISCAAFVFFYVCFHMYATVLFGFAARIASQESRSQVGHDAAFQAKATARMVVAAAFTFVYFSTAEVLRDDSAFKRWIFELSVPVSQGSDVCLALLCAGLIGSWHTRPERRLSDIGDLVRKQRERQIRKRLVEAAKASTGPAAMLAALIESQDADQLMFEAIQRFRCVSWDVLAHRPDVIIGGGPLNVVGAAGLDVYKLSKQCQISDCDAFVSHSWHDNGSQKWEALKAWCEDFERRQQRWPKLWLDRVCIDQQNIDADLRCLPIFLAGCERLLVLAGLTYTCRLWCCVELFVYMQMSADDSSRKPPIIKTIGANKAEIEQVRAAWLAFDAARCSCFKPEDKKRMLKIFETHPGGLAEFNRQIKSMAPGQATVRI